jgi:hypothetical protein
MTGSLADKKTRCESDHVALRGVRWYLNTDLRRLTTAIVCKTDGQSSLAKPKSLILAVLVLSGLIFFSHRNHDHITSFESWSTHTEDKGLLTAVNALKSTNTIHAV